MDEPEKVKQIFGKLYSEFGDDEVGDDDGSDSEGSGGPSYRSTRDGGSVPRPGYFLENFAKNCLDLTLNVEETDSDSLKVDLMKFRDLFVDGNNFSGGAKERYELFNFLQQYLASREALVIPGQTVLMHSDILKIPAQKHIEKLIFQTIGGSNDPVAADWHPVLITETTNPASLLAGGMDFYEPTRDEEKFQQEEQQQE